MKYFVIPLERAFLRRQFRSMRNILIGSSAIEPVEKSSAPQISSSVPVVVPVLLEKPKSISKEFFVDIKKPIDTFVSIQPKVSSWSNRSEVVYEAPKRVAPLKAPISVALPKPSLPKVALPKVVFPKVTLPNLPKLPKMPKLPHFPSLPKISLKTAPKVSLKLKKIIFGTTIAASLITLTILLAPSVYYTLFPSDPVPIKSDSSGSAMGGSYASGSSRVISRVVEPAYDENLPDGTWLIIPKIGVKTEILESADSEEALSKGVWRVPDFGTPSDLSKPMILAAHRYGWKAWWENGNQYWRYHSFYLLPKLEQGDLIEVISNHRKYLYEVYAGEQGEDITDYNADLILYTCKFLDSPLRYFRYARLVNPNKPAATSSK